MQNSREYSIQSSPKSINLQNNPIKFKENQTIKLEGSYQTSMQIMKKTNNLLSPGRTSPQSQKYSEKIQATP